MSDFGVQVLWTARYDYAKGEQLRLHRHDHCQIFWIADGYGQFQCDDEQYKLEPDTIFFVRPNQSHGLTVDAHTSVKTLDIKFHIVSEELLRATACIPVKTRQFTREIARLLELVRQEGMLRHRYYLALAALHMAELLYLLSRSAQFQADHPAASAADESPVHLPVSGTYLTLAEKMEQWILEHADQDWTMTAMSRHLGYSPGYLRQLFKAHKGLTIAAFLKEVRILRAKEWLSYSDLSIKQIAEKVGFKTVHHFTRVFKELEGIAPGRWMTREQLGIRKDVVFDDAHLLQR